MVCLHKKNHYFECTGKPLFKSDEQLENTFPVSKAITIILRLFATYFLKQTDLFRCFEHKHHGTIKSHCYITEVGCQSSSLLHNFKLQDNGKIS